MRKVGNIFSSSNDDVGSDDDGFGDMYYKV